MSEAPVTPRPVETRPVETRPDAPRRAPSLGGPPLLGVAVRMRRDPLGVLDNAFVGRDDTAVFLRLGPYRATLLSRPEQVRHVLVDNAANYSKQTRGYLKARLVLGDGLVTSEGDFWARQRRIATPAFHRQRVAALASVMTDAADEEYRAWPDAGRVDVFAAMMRLTLRIAVRTLLGGGDSRELDRVGVAVSEVLERTNDIITNPFALPLWAPLPKHRRFRAALQTLEGFVYATIAERRRAGDAERRDDLLSMLLSARDEQTGQTMSDRQLRDECVTILIAGYETTANALTWAAHLLATHPDAQARLRDEADGVVGERSPGAADFPALRWSRAVLDEAMRLYPPGWMLGRCARADDRVGAYLVRAGEFVLVSPYVLHRNPALWDNAAGFDPTRFLDGRAERLPKFAYLPFGGGQRFCIGSGFALMEGVLLLTMLARRFELTAASGVRVEPSAMITLRPRAGLPLQVRRRNAR